MLPEFRAEGGAGTGGHGRATASREHYPEPTQVASLPVWTDELGRALRLHCGIDHPPQSDGEAAVVMNHGLDLAYRLHLTSPQLPDELKRNYKLRARMLHPDTGGHEESFKVLQIAYRMLQQIKPEP